MNTKLKVLFALSAITMALTLQMKKLKLFFALAGIAIPLISQAIGQSAIAPVGADPMQLLQYGGNN
jgi:hypothetical protein